METSYWFFQAVSPHFDFDFVYPMLLSGIYLRPLSFSKHHALLYILLAPALLNAALYPVARNLLFILAAWRCHFRGSRKQARWGDRGRERHHRSRSTYLRRSQNLVSWLLASDLFFGFRSSRLIIGLSEDYLEYNCILWVPTHEQQSRASRNLRDSRPFLNLSRSTSHQKSWAAAIT